VAPFSLPSGFRMGGEPAWTVHHLTVPGNDPVAVRVRGPVRDAEVRVGEAEPVRARLSESDGPQGAVLLAWAGISHRFTHAAAPGGRWLGREGDTWQLQDHDPVEAALSGAAGAHGGDALTAPMPGTVTLVKASVGEEVAAGQSLLVVEAMKMEHVIAAPFAGTVTELDVTAGSTVAMDQVLAVVEPLQEGE
jgi:acetyl-CoA/propionyl-CoA carboxylase biotin carboxyl carrier protein